MFIGSGYLILGHVRTGNTPGAGTDVLIFAANGASKILIEDFLFYTNGGSNSGGGIVIKPQSGGTAEEGCLIVAVVIELAKRDPTPEVHSPTRSTRGLYVDLCVQARYMT